MSSIEQTKGIVQKLANQLGIEIVRFNSPKDSGRARLARVLLSRHVSLVFDVGAKSGQYATELRALGYPGRIVSFEPVAGAHMRLTKAAARDPKWIVASRTAIGSEEGVISVNVPASSVFGSALKDANLRRINASSAIACEEQVPLVTLNSLAPRHMGRGDVVFLKIDVRGFEYEVLRGADRILDALCGVELELSLVPLFQGEQPFRFMLGFMELRGFELLSVGSVLAGDATSPEIQLDAIFVRGGSAIN